MLSFFLGIAAKGSFKPSENYEIDPSVYPSGGVVQHHAGGAQQRRLLQLRGQHLDALGRGQRSLRDEALHRRLVVGAQHPRQDDQRRVDDVQDVDDAHAQRRGGCGGTEGGDDENSQAVVREKRSIFSPAFTASSYVQC